MDITLRFKGGVTGMGIYTLLRDAKQASMTALMNHLDAELTQFD